MVGSLARDFQTPRKGKPGRGLPHQESEKYVPASSVVPTVETVRSLVFKLSYEQLLGN